MELDNYDCSDEFFCEDLKAIEEHKINPRIKQITEELTPVIWDDFDASLLPIPPTA